MAPPVIDFTFELFNPNTAFAPDDCDIAIIDFIVYVMENGVENPSFENIQLSPAPGVPCT
jgi:hypothetical protein